MVMGASAGTQRVNKWTVQLQGHVRPVIPNPRVTCLPDTGALIPPCIKRYAMFPKQAVPTAIRPAVQMTAAPSQQRDQTKHQCLSIHSNITKYTTSGKDDTVRCSCHNNSLPSNAGSGIATWDNTTSGRCDWFTLQSTGVPHQMTISIHNATIGYYVSACHNGAPHFRWHADIGFSGLANDSSYSTNWNRNSDLYCLCHDPKRGTPNSVAMLCTLDKYYRSNL